jgi:hypothetical protein
LRNVDWKLSQKTDFGSPQKARGICDKYGGREYQPGGIQRVFRGVDMSAQRRDWPKDFFEIASSARMQHLRHLFCYFNSVINFHKGFCKMKIYTPDYLSASKIE